MHLALDPGDDRQGLAEVHLGVTRVMGQGDKDLAAPPAPFPDVILDDGVATLEAVLGAQSLENPLGRMPLLTDCPEEKAPPRRG
jgi:hypothetical protein